jgi:hypothetical protein
MSRHSASDFGTGFIGRATDHCFACGGSWSAETTHPQNGCAFATKSPPVTAPDHAPVRGIELPSRSVQRHIAATAPSPARAQSLSLCEALEHLARHIDGIAPADAPTALTALSDCVEGIGQRWARERGLNERSQLARATAGVDELAQAMRGTGGR